MSVGNGGTLSAAALESGWPADRRRRETERNVVVCDTATGRPIARHRSAHASPVSAIAFSGDGAKLATADVEGTIKIWEDARKLTSKTPRR